MSRAPKRFYLSVPLLVTSETVFSNLTYLLKWLISFYETNMKRVLQIQSINIKPVSPKSLCRLNKYKLTKYIREKVQQMSLMTIDNNAYFSTTKKEDTEQINWTMMITQKKHKISHPNFIILIVGERKKMLTHTNLSPYV